jgi:metallo-beta-lactamase family protein
MPPLPNLHLSRTAEDSKRIKQETSGAIILAGSGMCNGGRILHHFRNYIEMQQTRVLFTSYQAPGTLGRRIIEGEDDVRIHGRTYDVRAQVSTVGGMSAHADSEDLGRWYATFINRPPVFLVHGDPAAGVKLADELHSQLGATVTLAETGMIVDLLALAG